MVQRLTATHSTQENVNIPFVAQMAATAYDWVAGSDQVSEQQISGILAATGFAGNITGYNAGTHELCTCCALVDKQNSHLMCSQSFKTMACSTRLWRRRFKFI